MLGSTAAGLSFCVTIDIPRAMARGISMVLPCHFDDIDNKQTWSSIMRSQAHSSHTEVRLLIGCIPPTHMQHITKVLDNIHILQNKRSASNIYLIKTLNIAHFITRW